MPGLEMPECRKCRVIKLDVRYTLPNFVGNVCRACHNRYGNHQMAACSVCTKIARLRHSRCNSCIRQGKTRQNCPVGCGAVNVVCVDRPVVGPVCDACWWSRQLVNGVVNENFPAKSIAGHRVHVAALLGVQQRVDVWVVAWDPCRLVWMRAIAWRRYGVFVGLLRCVNQAGGRTRAAPGAAALAAHLDAERQAGRWPQTHAKVTLAVFCHAAEEHQVNSGCA